MKFSVPNDGDRSRLRASRQRNSPNGGIWDGRSARGSRRAGGKVVRKKEIAEGHTWAFRREGRSLRAASPGRLRWRGSPPVTSVRGGAGSTGRSTTRQRLTPNSARSGDASERLRMRGPCPRVASLPRSATWSGHRGTQRLEARLQMGGRGQDGREWGGEDRVRRRQSCRQAGVPWRGDAHPLSLHLSCKIELNTVVSS